LAALIGAQPAPRARAANRASTPLHEGAVAGGAPRFSIPLSTGSYAFIDALNSGNTGTVSTDDPNAKVFINTGGEYANWDAMVAANPTWRIGSGKVPFVIADQPGTYEISNIVLR